MRNTLSLIVFIFFMNVAADAQQPFTGVLINSLDSSTIAFATIKVQETRQTMTTDQHGRFNILLERPLKTFHVEITAIGIRTQHKVKLKESGSYKIYLELLPNELDDFVFEGLQPKTIVKRAVARIPLNYARKSHVSYSFYREYTRFNDRFVNLIEAKLAVLFRTHPGKRVITCEEAYAVLSLRRSNITTFEAYLAGPIESMLHTNPVYNLDGASLKPGLLEKYEYEMISDTGADYIIRYQSQFSTETHGVRGWTIHDGEGTEEGWLYIDKSSFAIKRYERIAIHNPHYGYPLNDNFVLPRKSHTGEFRDGHLIVEYEEREGKCYLKKHLYSYGNDFYSVPHGTKDFTIRHYFEWYADSSSKYVTGDVKDHFYSKLSLAFMEYQYQPTEWESNPEFFFAPREEVYKSFGGIERLRHQFLGGSRRKETKILPVR